MAVNSENSYVSSTLDSTTSPDTNTLLQTSLSVFDVVKDGRSPNRILIAFVFWVNHRDIPDKYAVSTPSRVYYDSNDEGEVDLTLIDSFYPFNNDKSENMRVFVYAKVNPPRGISKKGYVQFPTDCIKKYVHWVQFNGTHDTLDHITSLTRDIVNTQTAYGTATTRTLTGLLSGSGVFQMWINWRYKVPYTSATFTNLIGFDKATSGNSAPTRNAGSTLDSALGIATGEVYATGTSASTSMELSVSATSPSDTFIYSIKIMPYGWVQPDWWYQIGEYIEPPCGYVGQVAGSSPDLSHLEGQTVAIYANGTVMDEQVVTDGAVTFPSGLSLIHIGLPFYSDFETLNVEVPDKEGTVQSKRCKINNVMFRLQDSRGGFIGPDEDNLWEAFTADAIRKSSGQNINDDELFTGDIRQPLGAQFGDEGHIFFRQVDPLPISIGAVIPEVEYGGRSR